LVLSGRGSQLEAWIRLLQVVAKGSTPQLPAGASLKYPPGGGGADDEGDVIIVGVGAAVVVVSLTTTLAKTAAKAKATAARRGLERLTCAS
jgi:hypothetical protein